MPLEVTFRCLCTLTWHGARLLDSISACTEEHPDSQTGVIKNVHFINLSCFSNVTGKCYLAFCDLHLTVKMYMHGGGSRRFV